MEARSLIGYSRRAILGTLEKVWLLFAVFPRTASASACCPNYYYSCTDCGGNPDCDGSSGAYGAGTDPSVACFSMSACTFCTTGCYPCIYTHVATAADCCGSVYDTYSYQCCADPDCCPGGDDDDGDVGDGEDVVDKGIIQPTATAAIAGVAAIPFVIKLLGRRKAKKADELEGPSTPDRPR